MIPEAPHIFTFTGNLLAERTYEFTSWEVGATQRAQGQSFQVGGKGINVAKMLTRLGVPNTALCFVGGPSGAECETWLRDRAFSAQTFQTSQPTRRGTVVRAPGIPETTFLGPDAAPDDAAVRACADYLDSQPPGHVLAVCGSIPGWDSAAYSPLRSAFERWLSRGVLVADTYGPPLRSFAAQPLHLLKINATEMQTAGGTGAPLDGWPAQRVVITDGPKPIKFREAGSPPQQIEPPRVQEVSPTGSGDVMLACLIRALYCERKSLRDAVAFALPFAAANAAHPGVAEFPNP